MPSRQLSGTPRYTRRQVLDFGLGLGTGMALGAGGFRGAHAHVADRFTQVASGDYAHPDALADVTWLEANRADPSVVVVGFMPVEEFERGHIPGSVQIDWPELEVIDTSDASIDAWQDDVAQMLGNLGITRDSTVVVYDAGTLFAARLWWILHYLGHEDATVLNGGLPAWSELGNEAETGPVFMPAIERPPYAGDPEPDHLAQKSEVMTSLDDEQVVILDARTPEEYAEGHIPGAVNLNFPLNALPEPPKFWKPGNELTSMYEEIGVTSDKQVIPYCTSGVRSAVTTFTLHLIGFDNVALYTGSWQEWAEDLDAPRTAGNQP